MSLQADMDVCLQSFWGMFLMCDSDPTRAYHTGQPGAASTFPRSATKVTTVLQAGTAAAAWHSCGQWRIMGCANTVALFREGTRASMRG